MLAVLTVVIVACAGPGSDEVTTTSTLGVTTTSAPATSTTQPPPDCPPAPYELTVLPVGVGEGELESSTLDPDVWTSVPGSNTTFVPRSDDTVAVALI
ncbi:MAG: hypothetical protein WAL25_01570, partial [Acidimicrobiia bacterium]